MRGSHFILSVGFTAGAVALFCWSVGEMLIRKNLGHWPKWSTGKAGVPISRRSLFCRAVFSAGLILIVIPAEDPWVGLTGILVALLGTIGGTISFARDSFGSVHNP